MDKYINLYLHLHIYQDQLIRFSLILTFDLPTRTLMISVRPPVDPSLERVHV